MIITVEEIVYIYIGVCISMLIFNVFIIFFRKSQYKRFKTRTRDISKLIDVQLEHIARKQPIKRTIQIKLDKMLTAPNKLMAFHEAIEAALEQDAVVVQQYLLLSRPLFGSLAVKYMQKDDIRKAYFAYLMSRYKVCKDIEQDEIINSMLQLIDTKSAYCRENALKALYSFGNEKNVLSAIMLINKNEIFHHEKLLSDGLLSFEGDKARLGALLWEHFNEFNNDIQVSIVKFLHADSDQFKEELYSLLIRQETNKEVKVAIIRYFGKYVYEPMYHFLHTTLTEASDDWEIIAISATVIRAYPTPASIEALKIAMHHSNWYIRFNAAETLNALRKNYNELASIYNGTDRFARDMLLYQDQRTRIKAQAQQQEAVRV
jgi:hypothetical protein